MASNQLLFSVTKKDLDIEYYKASSGPGGQNCNKVASAVRIKHRASGAAGKSNTHRTQHQNLREAFHRLVQSKEFQTWMKMEAAARIQGYSNVEAKVDEMMDEDNLKIEVFEEGKWKKE